VDLCLIDRINTAWPQWNADLADTRGSIWMKICGDSVNPPNPRSILSAAEWLRLIAAMIIAKEAKIMHIYQIP
jgi:hypothetical protein